MAPDEPDFDPDLDEAWLDGPEPEETGPWSDQAFWVMARRVRQVAEQELGEIEYESERAELKREDLTARSVRAMMEGERWQVVVGPKVIEGIVVHAGMNFLGMQDRAGNLHDLAHHAIGLIRLVAQDPTQGRAPITFRPATFRARLLGLEQTRSIEVAAAAGSWTLTGSIDSVNSDHVVFVDQSHQVSLIPIDAIGCITRSAPQHRRGTLPPVETAPVHRRAHTSADAATSRWTA